RDPGQEGGRGDRRDGPGATGHKDGPGAERGGHEPGAVKRTLHGAGLVLRSADSPRGGRAVGQNPPANSSVNRGSTVVVTFQKTAATGHGRLNRPSRPKRPSQQVVVPPVIGMTRDRARGVLEGSGLRMRTNGDPRKS